MVCKHAEQNGKPWLLQFENPTVSLAYRFEIVKSNRLLERYFKL